MQEEIYKRPSWDEYFLEIVEKVGTRSTCDRARKSGGGCFIVKNRLILVSGYVGSPPGIDHCDDVGHEYKKITHEDGHVTEHCVRTTHAEQNAICQAGKNGIAIDGATLYSFMTPCYTCAKLLITAGIKRVVAYTDYHTARESKELFLHSGIEFTIVHKQVTQYDRQ